MSNYSMDISGKINLADYSNIYDYLKIIDKDDEFRININKNNKNDIEIISSMLVDNQFDIVDAKYDKEGNYHINASKIF